MTDLGRELMEAQERLREVDEKARREAYKAGYLKAALHIADGHLRLGPDMTAEDWAAAASEALNEFLAGSR